MLTWFYRQAKFSCIPETVQYAQTRHNPIIYIVYIPYRHYSGEINKLLYLLEGICKLLWNVQGIVSFSKWYADGLILVTENTIDVLLDFSYVKGML